VAANACTDNTAILLQNYQTQPAENVWLPLIWLEEVTPGKSHASNCAIPELCSDLTAFVYDDHRVDEASHPRYDPLLPLYVILFIDYHG